MDDVSAYVNRLKEFAKDNLIIDVTHLVCNLIAYSNAIGELELYNYFFSDDLATDEHKVFREPVQYWLVTAHFAHLLLKQNELVSSSHKVYIWGRCSSSHPIYFDPVVKKIFDAQNVL